MRAASAARFLASIVLASVAACGGSPDGPTTPTPRGDSPPGPPPPLSGQSAVVVAVADIGECGSPGVEQSARLADRIDGQVILAGDLAYYQGTMADFLRCFDPSWGRFRDRWRPAPGNHEYETPGAAGYFQYFGEAAGQGFYSFRTGDWQVLMLNSNVQAGVGRESAQFEFVRAELARHRTPCTMAVWHHPLFSSGPNGSSLFMQDLWRLLYEQDADVIVAGHDHLYERFAKQDAEGRSDVRGLRQFIVGTGGAQLYDFMRVTPNSQARIKAHGVLRLTLHPSSYEWAFIDATGGVADSGSDGCH